jgi:hypothetical protein
VLFAVWLGKSVGSPTVAVGLVECMAPHGRVSNLPQILRRQTHTRTHTHVHTHTYTHTHTLVSHTYTHLFHTHTHNSGSIVS